MSAGAVLAWAVVAFAACMMLGGYGAVIAPLGSRLERWCPWLLGSAMGIVFAIIVTGAICATVGR